MSTVLVDYYEAVCVRCGWHHRVMYGGGMGTVAGHAAAVAVHQQATGGHCTATPGEIREQGGQAAGGGSYRWTVGDVFTNGVNRWRVDMVSADGETAVLGSCSTAWAKTRLLTVAEWHEGGRWRLEAKP